jgi:hypothetical protein
MDLPHDRCIVAVDKAAQRPSYLSALPCWNTVGSSTYGMSGILFVGPADWRRRAIIGNSDLRANDHLSSLVDADDHSEPHRWQYCVLDRVALVQGLGFQIFSLLPDA